MFWVEFPIGKEVLVSFEERVDHPSRSKSTQSKLGYWVGVWALSSSEELKSSSQVSSVVQLWLLYFLLISVGTYSWE
jgi:hypothetical protein